MCAADVPTAFPRSAADWRTGRGADSIRISPRAADARSAGGAAAILAGMWLVMRFATAPGAPAGVNPMEAKEWLFCNWVDVNFLTTAHRPEGGFTTITMVATAMFGMFAVVILTSQSSQRQKAARLVLFALGLVSAGLLMALAFGPYSLPVNKPVWTSSFALVAGGISAGLLARFYWIVVTQAGMMAIVRLFLYWLYRKGTFLRV